MPPPLIVIGGPTASGKTQAAIALARTLGGEILGADSIQIYKHLDIGSAKPTPLERSQLVDPTVAFSGGMYQEQARGVVERLEAQGKPVVVCGGTGLYIQALVRGLFPGPKADPHLRQELTAQEEREPGALKCLLAQIDPESARRLHENDRVRLIRALEVYYLTGISLTEHHRRHRKMPPFRRALTFVLTPPKELLEERIHKRVQGMLSAGFIQEVQGLLKRGYSPDLKALQSVGYRQVLSFLRGELQDEEALALAISQAHLRYVKQQRTWFSGTGHPLSSHDALPIAQIKAYLATCDSGCAHELPPPPWLT